MFVKKKRRKKPEGEGAPAPEKPSLSHFHYGNITELGAAGQFVTSLDSSGSVSLRVSNRVYRIKLTCHIQVGLGTSQTNADSQQNPVHNASHQNLCCGNETTRQQLCKSDLDVANLRPAPEQGCGKQTPSAGKLSFRANFLYAPNIKMQRGLRPRTVHNFGTRVWRTNAQWQLPETNVFRRRKNQILPLRCGSPNASTKAAHRPRSPPPPHSDIRHIQQTRSEKQSPSAWRSPSAVPSERRPQACRVKITSTKLLTNRFVSTTKNPMKCAVN